MRGARSHRDGAALARNRARRSAFTLLEMVLSLAVTSILMLAIGAALALAGRSVGTAAAADLPALDAARSLRDLTADLNLALVFTEREDHAVEFTVPDRDDDGEPELLRYAWSGAAGDPLERWTNGNGPVTVARNVHQLDFSYLIETRGPPPPPPEVESPELELFAHDDDPGGQLVPDRYAAEIALLVSWGYRVSPIDVAASTAEFDAAILAAAVAVIPPGTDDAILGTKLRQAVIGVVTEAAELTEEMGLALGPGVEYNQEKIKIISDDAPHFITDPFGDGDLKISEGQQALIGYPGPLGDALSIAKHKDGDRDSCVAVLEPGDGLLGPGSGTAPARRVFMPWGSGDFDFDTLNDDGRTLYRRAVDWAANGAPGNDVLYVVDGLGTGLDELPLLKDHGPALYVPAPDLPVNAASWSITRFLLIAGQHGEDLGGEIDLALTLPGPDMTPSTFLLWSRDQFKEADLPGSAAWLEFLVEDVTNLDPEQGVCLQVLGQKATAPKRDGRIGLEANDAFLESGALYMTTTDNAETWTAPSPDRRLRLYIYGTYTTIGPPVWWAP